MKILAWLVGAAVLPALAANYYFDNLAGKDSNPGTTSVAPWKSLSKFKTIKVSAGDSILLGRGSNWIGESLYVSATGTSDHPVVFSAYGDPTAPRPHIDNKGALFVLNRSRHVVVENLELSGAHGGCVEMRDSSNAHIVVQSIEAHDCGCGISMTGTDITVRGNHVHDGHMVVNTPNTMDDDYGATGIGFSRLDGCKVHGNRLENLVAPSYDYGVDGGALEFWKTTRHCDVQGNFAFNANGFTEYGGQKGDSIVDVAIHHNIYLESGILACFHLADSTMPFGLGYDNLRLDNNLGIVRKGKGGGFHLVADGAPLPDRNRIKVRNNIFVTDSSNYYTYQQNGASQDPTWTHEHNIVWNRKNNPFRGGWVAGEGEVFAEPLFANSAWNATSQTDTIVSHYAPSAPSPAVGKGVDLGYATDFFGRPATREGLVEIGPIAYADPTSVRTPVRGTHLNSVFVSRRTGALLVTTNMPASTLLRPRLVDAHGKIVRVWNEWEAVAGNSTRSLVGATPGAGLYFLVLNSPSERARVVPLSMP